MKNENIGFLRYICLGLLIIFCGSILLRDLLSVKQTQASMLGLPEPSQLLTISSNGDLPLLKALRMNPQNPLDFEFVIGSDNKPKEEQSIELIKYFLAAITIPQDDLWVNLSPYENDRISSENLSYTDMGRELLAQDYILKQLSSSLTQPDSDLGRKFWNNNNSIKQSSAFSKVWITPDSARVVENGFTAVITESTLQVQSEYDYLAAQNNQKNNNEEDSQSIDLLLPTVTEQVNNGKHFAKLRQIYSALILAQWFKQKFSNTFYKDYIDKNKIKGIEIEDKKAKDKIWKLYCDSFEKGVYSIVQKNANSADSKKQKIKYFSGGFKNSIDLQVEGKNSSSVLAQEFEDQDYYSQKFKVSSSIEESYGDMQKRVKAEKKELDRLFEQENFVFESKRIAKAFSEGSRFGLPTITDSNGNKFTLSIYIPSVEYQNQELKGRITKDGDEIKIDVYDSNDNLIISRYAAEKKSGSFTMVDKLSYERVKMKNFVEGKQTGRQTFHITAFRSKRKNQTVKYAEMYLFTKGNDNSANIAALDIAFDEQDVRVDVIKKTKTTIFNVYHKNKGNNYVTYFYEEDEDGLIRLFKKDETRRRKLRDFLVNKNTDTFSTKLRVDEYGKLNIYRNDTRRGKQNKDDYFSLSLQSLESFANKELLVDTYWNGTNFVISVYDNSTNLVVEKMILKGSDDVWRISDAIVPHEELMDKLTGRKKIIKFAQQVFTGKTNMRISEKINISGQEKEEKRINFFGVYFNKQLFELRADLDQQYHKDSVWVDIVVDEDGKSICRLLDDKNNSVLAEKTVDLRDIELYGLNSSQQLNVYGKRLMNGEVVDELIELEPKFEAKHNGRYRLRIFSYKSPLDGKNKVEYMALDQTFSEKLIAQIESFESDSKYIGQISLYKESADLDNLIAVKKLERPVWLDSNKKSLLTNSTYSLETSAQDNNLEKFLRNKQRQLDDPESFEAETEIEIPDVDNKVLLNEQANVADNMIFGFGAVDQGAWRTRDHDDFLTVKTYSFVEKDTGKNLRREVRFSKTDLQYVDLEKFFVRLRLSRDKKTIYGDVYDTEGKLIESGMAYSQIADSFDPEFLEKKRNKLMTANQAIVLKKLTEGIEVEDKGAWRNFKKSDQRLSAGGFVGDNGFSVTVNYKLTDSVANEFPFVLEPDAKLFVKYSLSKDKRKIYLNAFADEECKINVLKDIEVLSGYLNKKRNGLLKKSEPRSVSTNDAIDYSAYTRAIADDAKIDEMPIRKITNENTVPNDPHKWDKRYFFDSDIHHKINALAFENYKTTNKKRKLVNSLIKEVDDNNFTIDYHGEHFDGQWVYMTKKSGSKTPCVLLKDKDRFEKVFGLVTKEIKVSDLPALEDLEGYVRITQRGLSDEYRQVGAKYTKFESGLSREDGEHELVWKKNGRKFVFKLVKPERGKGNAEKALKESEYNDFIRAMELTKMPYKRSLLPEFEEDRGYVAIYHDQWDKKYENGQRNFKHLESKLVNFTEAGACNFVSGDSKIALQYFKMGNKGSKEILAISEDKFTDLAKELNLVERTSEVVQEIRKNKTRKVRGLETYINLIAKEKGTFADLLDLLKDKEEFSSYSVEDLFREVMRLMKKPLSIEQKQGLVRMKLGEIIEGAFVLELSNKINPTGKLKEYVQYFVQSKEDESKVGFVNYVTVDPQTGDKKYYEINLGNAYYDIIRKLTGRVDPELFGYSADNPKGIKADQLKMVYLEENEKVIWDLMNYNIESISIGDVLSASDNEIINLLRQIADQSDNDHKLDYDDIDLLTNIVLLQKYFFFNVEGQKKKSDYIQDYNETVAVVLDDLSELARKRKETKLSQTELKEKRVSILSEIDSLLKENKNQNPGYDAAFNPETNQYQSKLSLIPSLANFNSDNLLIDYDLELREISLLNEKSKGYGKVKFDAIEQLYHYVIDNFVTKDKIDYFKEVYDNHKETILSSTDYGLDYLLEFINVQNEILQSCLVQNGEPYSDAHVFLKAVMVFQRAELFKALDKIEVVGDKLKSEQIMDALRNGHYFGESIKLFDVYDDLISTIKKELPMIFEESYSNDNLIKYRIGSTDVYEILNGERKLPMVKTERSSTPIGGIDLELFDLNVDSSSSALENIDIDFKNLKGFSFKPSSMSKIASIREWCMNN